MNESYSSYESFFDENEKKIKRAESNVKKQQQDCRALVRELSVLNLQKSKLEKESIEKTDECQNLIKNQEFLEKSLFVIL